jgi:hypothetical protein
MNLVTVGKNGRVYQRSFDHERAQAMHSDGMSYAAIGEQLGVSAMAVARVCNPETRAKIDAKVREYSERQRRLCLGGCGKLVWRHGRQGRQRTGYCTACMAVLLTAGDERQGELRCTKCRKWKPDGDFRPIKGRRTRRGRNSQCRRCEADVRADHRHRNGEASRRTDRERKRKQQNRKAVMRTYLVLCKNGDSGWREVGQVAATSAVSAVEKTVHRPGTFTAVSEGSIVEVEPITTMKATRRRPVGARGGDDG